jgi:hypothetical protein
MSSSSSSNVPIPQMSRTQIELLFAVWGQVVVGGTYYRGATTATVSMIVMPIRPAMADGVTILPGDEKVLVQATDLTGLTEPRAGDYVVEAVSGLRRDVVVAQLDMTRQLWTFFARKVLV